MGKELAASYPVARETFAEADRALGYAISDLCFNGPEEKLKGGSAVPVCGEELDASKKCAPREFRLVWSTLGTCPQRVGGDSGDGVDPVKG